VSVQERQQQQQQRRLQQKQEQQKSQPEQLMIVRMLVNVKVMMIAVKHIYLDLLDWVH